MPPDPGVATGILLPPVSIAIGSGQGSDFGQRTPPAPGASEYHRGVDYPVSVGTPIRAADGGRVIFADSAGSAGNATVIDHGNGMVTRYFHQERISVSVGDEVAQGQVIGRSGQTGIGSGAHLHFELRQGGTSAFRSDAQALDPEPLFGRAYTSATPGRSTSQAPAAPIADPYLRNGDSGTQVTEMQQRLKALGYDLGTTGRNRDGVDGDFGDATQRVVQRFQRDRGLPEGQQQGLYGPISRREMADAERTGWRAPATPQAAPATPAQPSAGTTAPPAQPPTARATDTAGPFAATSVGALVGPTVPAGQSTPLGALNATQSYALGRAVFGDGPGAAALERVDRQLGTGSGVFVQRMIALGQHEGSLNFGRTNADPASGSNVGTFQVGGAGSTPEQTRARYEGFVTSGMRTVEALGGPRVDPRTLSQADRDVFAHIAHMTNRASESRRPADALLRQMADPTVRGEALVTLVHRGVQGGIRDIGTGVLAMTSATQGMRVDLAAVSARGAEPAATRREPAMPVLDNSLRFSVSPAVAQWQAVLKAQGLPTGSDQPNGVYNAATLASTRALQSRANLGPDGTVGPATWTRYAGIDGREIPAAAPRQTAPAAPQPAAPGATTPRPATPAPATPRPVAPPSGDGASTPAPATPAPATPRTTQPGDPAPRPATVGGATPGQPGPGQPAPGPGLTPHPAAGAFIREADEAVSNLLDRHTADVPGALRGLIEATRGPGSGVLGRTTAEDVQQAFGRLSAGTASRPLSKTEAGLIAGVLDERARLVGDGTTPTAVSSGDGANRTPVLPAVASPSVSPAPPTRSAPTVPQL